MRILKLAMLLAAAAFTGQSSAQAQHMYGGVEIPILEVHEAGLAITGTPLMTPDYDLEPSIRFWAGRESCSGLGARITYFDFDDSASSSLFGVDLGTAVDIYALDLELTQSTDFCGWDLLVSGGLRVGGIDQDLSVSDGTDFASLSRDFDGFGLTFGLAGSRDLFRRVGAYGKFRGSLLYGDADINLSDNGALFDAPTEYDRLPTIPNQTVSILGDRNRPGLQHFLPRRHPVTARVGLEAQVWEQPPRPVRLTWMTTLVSLVRRSPWRCGTKPHTNAS